MHWTYVYDHPILVPSSSDSPFFVREIDNKKKPSFGTAALLKKRDMAEGKLTGGKAGPSDVTMLGQFIYLLPTDKQVEATTCIEAVMAVAKQFMEKLKLLPKGAKGKTKAGKASDQATRHALAM